MFKAWLSRFDDVKPEATPLLDRKLETPLEWIARVKPKVRHPSKGLIVLEPREYQEALLDAWLHPNRVIVKARQIGITQILGIEAVVKTGVNGFPIALTVSRKEDQAKEFVRYAREAALQDPEIGALVTDNSLELEFQDGSRIVAQAAGKDAGRGFPASDVYIDEIAFQQWAKDIYQSIEPTVSNGGRVTVFSSPKGRADTFYQIWAGLYGTVSEAWKPERTRPERDGKVWWRYDFPYRVLWDEAWADAKRATMTREGFAEEYMGEEGFIATGGAMFEESDLMACFLEGGVREVKRAGRRYLVTADIAGAGEDATVIQVWDVTDYPYRLVHTERWVKGPFQKFFDRLQAIVGDYGPYGVWVDATGMGAPIAETVEAVYGPRGHGFLFTHKSKYEALTALQLLVQKHGLLYDDAQLHSEMGLYQEDDKDLITDCVMAAAIMAHATRQPRNAPPPPDALTPVGFSRARR